MSERAADRREPRESTSASTPSVRWAPHGLTPEESAQHLGSDAQHGLTRDEAEARLARYGLNRLPEPPRPSEILRFLRQLTSPLVGVLLVAAAIAFAVGVTATDEPSLFHRYGDALAILIIVLLNALLGYVQEQRAASALDSLRRLSVPTARVRRDGLLQQISAEQLVPGDVIELEDGDAVPADARLLEAIELTADESALTGESLPVRKDARAVVPVDAPLAEQASMLRQGTAIVRGKARALVTFTGRETELGAIGKLLAAETTQPTPLEEDLHRFGRRILWACLATSVVLFALGLWKGERSWPILLLEATSFAVAAIPEGLPAITTITLALGTHRMARRGVLVRKLAAVEALGAASVICTDKTGTLTQNQMTVREVYAAAIRYRVSGEGYAPAGAFFGEAADAPIASATKTDALPPDALPAPLKDLCLTAILCNNASLRQSEDPQLWQIVGDPTEGALLTLAEKAGYSHEEEATAFRRIMELPFDAERKRMTVVVRDAQGHETVHVKGSLDVLLPLCTQLRTPDGTRPLVEEDRQRVLHEGERMSRAALRVLALARRDGPAGATAETDLTLLGLVGMMDPPRSGVKQAIAACQEASVAVVMITGDHPLTARAIGDELGLLRPGDTVLTGPELAQLSDLELRARVDGVRIFARATAEQKLRIVRAFKAHGHIVAMTGDGVNDAPALREAHVGIAMGRCGTDVARQASGVVLTDDNFATIVAGLREGRAVYRNIQKSIVYLLSSNVALAVAVFATAFRPEWLPLTPLMILLINLVTNGLPALALGVDPPDAQQMREPPRNAERGMLWLYDYAGIAYVGGLMGIMALLMYIWPELRGQPDPAWSRTLAFALLALQPLVHAWSCSSPLRSAFAQRPIVRLPMLGACAVSAALLALTIGLPPLRSMLHTVVLRGTDWLLLAAVSLLILPVVEVAKWIARRALPQAAP
ncbi:MAG: cation-transporting P-type ATPase [Polyangia bacterium]